MSEKIVKGRHSAMIRDLNGGGGNFVSFCKKKKNSTIGRGFEKHIDN